MERVECAKPPRVSFLAALAELDQATPVLKGSDVWLVWHDEAQNRLTAAQSRLVHSVRSAVTTHVSNAHL